MTRTPACRPRCGWLSTTLALALLGGLLLTGARAGVAGDGDLPALYRLEGVADTTDRSRVAATGALIIEAEVNSVLVEATAEEIRSLEQLGLRPVRVADADPQDLLPFPAQDSDFHDYAEMVDLLQETARRYPAIFALSSIGQSHQGRELWLGKLSDNVGIDEREPEFLFTHHQHAREHLTVEQGLYTLRMLTEEYGTDPRVTRLVNEREIWIVFDVNPDGGEFDIQTGDYVSWRKNRQPNPDSDRVGTDVNRNWGFRWGCCGGSSGSVASSTYRGPVPFSAPEIDLIRRFVESRVIDGVQQISTALDFHSFGELILWPYGYTTEDVPNDMDPDDQAAFVAMGQAMGALNGYRPQQASDLYVADGVSIDWKYGAHGIFAYTLEMYPRSNRDGGFYPSDEVIPVETARNRDAILYLLELADCPYRSIGKEGELCGVIEPNRDSWTRPASEGRPSPSR